jgi:hypothetical protein
MEQSSGPLDVEMVQGKHCNFSTYLFNRARAQSAACAEVQFIDYGTMLWSPVSRNGSRKAGKHCYFSPYLTKRARAQFGTRAEVQHFDYGTVLWAPGSRKDSRNSLRFQHLPFKRERELTLAHVQRCSFLIMEQCCGPLCVEIVPRKHCDFSTYLAKRTRVQSRACAEVQFPEYGTELWSPGSRICSRKALRFQHLSCQESESSVWSMRRGAFS